MQCGGAGADGEGVVRAHSLGEGGFEGGKVRAEHEVAVADGTGGSLRLFLAHRRLRQPNSRISHQPIFPPEGWKEELGKRGGVGGVTLR